MPERTIHIGVGSNIEPQRHVPAALASLEADYGPLIVSTLYRCAAVGLDGPCFINAVVGLRSGVALETLHEQLKALERKAGRDHSKGLAGRELDLDLLLFGEERIASGGIVIPRPDILGYAFVLRPLAEMAPDARHPVTGRSYAWHWKHFEGEDIALEPVRLDGIEYG